MGLGVWNYSLPKVIAVRLRTVRGAISSMLWFKKCPGSIFSKSAVVAAIGIFYFFQVGKSHFLSKERKSIE